jgi:iron complex outermembrane receptor protein
MCRWYFKRAFTDLTDGARVEVLRGLQSTLYGKSASSGLVNITTRAPSDEFTSQLDLQATIDDEYRDALSVSGPDRLAFELSRNGQPQRLQEQRR